MFSLKINTDKQKNIITFFIILFLSLTYLGTQPALINKYKQGDDCQTRFIGFMPMYGFDQFNNDSLSKIISGINPLGYKLIYQFFSPFTDILIVPKFIQVFLFFLLVLYSYKIGSFYSGRTGGIFSVLFVLTTQWTMAKVAGGLPKNFSPVLFSSLIYYSLKKDQIKILIISLLGTLFYPVIMIVALSTFGIFQTVYIFEHGLHKYIQSQKKEIIFFIACISLILLFSITYKRKSHAINGPIYTFQEAFDNAHFQEGGRLGKQVPFPYLTEYLGYLFRVGGTRAVYANYTPDMNPFNLMTEEQISQNVSRWHKNHGELKTRLKLFYVANPILAKWTNKYFYVR